jgi:hypothetical protein
VILKTTRVGDRALVSFSDAAESIYLYLPDKGTPGNVAGVLSEVVRAQTPGAFAAGVVAADFVAAVKPAVRPRIVSEHNLVAFWSRSDYRVYVNDGSPRDRGMRVDVRRVVNGVQDFASLYAGPVQGFPAWAQGQPQTGLEAAVRKVVRFKYNGGSKPGQYRTVLVEDVERDGNGVGHICGLDLEKADLKGAFRKYSVEKIVGDVEVVN